MLENYTFNVFVWLCILIPILFVIYVIVKRKPLLIAILGLLIMLSAAPIGFMTEFAVTGCCGAPSTGYEGTGFWVGGAIATSGILLIVFRNKLGKK